MDTILEGFKRDKPAYGNPCENEAQAMFEALTTSSEISLYKRMIERI